MNSTRAILCTSKPVHQPVTEGQLQNIIFATWMLEHLNGDQPWLRRFINVRVNLWTEPSKIKIDFSEPGLTKKTVDHQYLKHFQHNSLVCETILSWIFLEWSHLWLMTGVWDGLGMISSNCPNVSLRLRRQHLTPEHQRCTLSCLSCLSSIELWFVRNFPTQQQHTTKIHISQVNQDNLFQSHVVSGRSDKCQCWHSSDWHRSVPWSPLLHSNLDSLEECMNLCVTPTTPANTLCHFHHP